VIEKAAILAFDPFFIFSLPHGITCMGLAWDWCGGCFFGVFLDFFQLWRLFLLGHSFFCFCFLVLSSYAYLATVAWTATNTYCTWPNEKLLFSNSFPPLPFFAVFFVLAAFFVLLSQRIEISQDGK
jgi:hypothetical protein